MIFFKILGWVLLSILALVIIALCIRVRVIAEYSSKTTSVVVKWLFLSIPVYPQKTKKNKKQKAAPEDSAAEEAAIAEKSANSEETAGSEETATTEPDPKAAKPDAQNKPSFLKQLYEAEGVDGIILLLKRIASYLGTFFGRLLRAPLIDEFYLDVCCTRSDAASTAVYYGEVCSALFPVLGSLVAACRIKKYDVNVYPDFIARFSDASFYIDLHIVPIYLVVIVLALAFKLFFKVALRILVKIFLPKKSKPSNNTEKENITSKEKSVISNE